MKNVIIIVLIIFNLLLILIRYSDVFVDKNIKRSDNKWMMEDVANDIYKNYQYENCQLYRSHSADSILKSIVDKSYKLFYKIPFPFCDDCVMPMLKELQLFADSASCQKVVLLTSFPTRKEVNLFVNRMNIGDNFYLINIPEAELSLDMKEMIGAYAFLLNREIQPEYIYFSSKFNSFCHSSYLKAIKKHLVKVNL